MLTERELTERAATKVMGWGLVKRISGGVMFDRRDRCHVDIHEWQPLTDIRAAWEIVEKMRAEGWYLHCDCGPSKTARAIFHSGMKVFAGRDLEGGGIPRAIVTAALLAVGAVTREEIE